MVSAEMMRVRLGLRADDGSMDEVIETLLAEAEAYAKDYCRLREGETVPDYLCAQMCAEAYGQLGGEGLSARTLSGMAEYYRGQYSDEILAQLRAMRHPANPGRQKKC